MVMLSLIRINGMGSKVLLSELVIRIPALVSRWTRVRLVPKYLVVFFLHVDGKCASLRATQCTEDLFQNSPQKCRWDLPRARELGRGSRKSSIVTLTAAVEQWIHGAPAQDNGKNYFRQFGLL